LFLFPRRLGGRGVRGPAQPGPYPHRHVRARASVYCTAWTFYGSVGLAANRGLEFLTIYLGPALVALLWPVVLRKLVRVSQGAAHQLDLRLISSRYGKSAHLGTLVALLVVAGMIPYIALQLRAVSASFRMIVHEDSVLNVLDPTLLREVEVRARTGSENAKGHATTASGRGH